MSRLGKRDLNKEHFWRRVILQWQRGNQTIRGFCAAHHLSEACFHAWRRTIAQRDQADAKAKRGHGEQAPGALTFVPVHVLPATDKTDPSGKPLELVVGQGRVIRVTAGFDAATLRQLLAVLEGPSC